MKKHNHVMLVLFLNLLLVGTAFPQKKISEFTIVYNYTLTNMADSSKQAGSSLNAVNTIYIKGNMSRSEMVSSLFSSNTIYDTKTGTAVILREVNGQKLLIRMTADDWQDKNKRYTALHFSKSPESRTIAGYKCEKAMATTADGLTITVYYTKDLIPENKDYAPEFRTLEGFPLEYELAKGKLRIKYSLSSIDLNPVPASKFDIPKSGYREMTYGESKKLNVEK